MKQFFSREKFIIIYYAFIINSTYIGVIEVTNKANRKKIFYDFLC